jgi:transcription initiation factor TFIIIB Brf1 subunit/transcription initiation factor TFIIB
MEQPQKCPKCSEFCVIQDPISQASTCENCGFVLEENTIRSEVEIQLIGSNVARTVGVVVSAFETGGNTFLGPSNSRPAQFKFFSDNVAQVREMKI